jgi:oligoribonuclease NrnB/cAMP/cGMP phosphodiesterase (DHH superfamily)
MKTVDVHFKKIDVIDYYSQLDQVKVRVLFDDGKEKAFIKQVSVKDPSRIAAEWLYDIKQEVKDAHSELSLDDHPLANAVVLRFKQEPDIVEEKMARFLAQVKERIRAGKLANLSYYDMESKLVNFSSKLN